MAAQSSGKNKTNQPEQFSAGSNALPKADNMPQQMYHDRPIRPMKLFTEWDVENAAPNCIPR